ncbi:MAG: tRNA-dihydrouridine synthase family protein [Bacteriovoracaceae bacterium]|nr:tRNA-dihydrouridine synthase family protein [Bacteriovoracaceae bacterium]
MTTPVPHSIIFAPMEGITDTIYRETIMKHDPAWDYYSAEFFRIPTVGNVKSGLIINHIGKNILEKQALLNKTIFQILATPRTQNENSSKIINELNLPWLDLNFGCPSRQVNRHGGGAKLLDSPLEIKKIVMQIRKHYNGFLSAKIRIGMNDDRNFLQILQILEDEGVELITIHARTRKQMYQEQADWSYIKNAVDKSSLPIVGNGDIKTLTDIEKIFSKTNCHSIMIGRGALKSPWIADQYKNRTKYNISEEGLFLFQKLFVAYSLQSSSSKARARLKQHAHYIFENSPETRQQILRSQSLVEIEKIITD